MITINWSKFQLKNKNTTEAFESLCYFLFCRKFQITEGIHTDFNQVGLETEPIQDCDGKWWGFQSKFFEKNMNYLNISQSISKAVKAYKNLDYIIVYVNLFVKTTCNAAKKIEDICRKENIELIWYLPQNFEVELNQPNNLDLAEFFFGDTNLLEAIADSKSVRMNTLLHSKEYLELQLKNNKDVLTITHFCNEILEKNSKLFLLTGNAGTGKSVCMRKISNIFSGLEEESADNQLRKIESVNALCVFINLNNTSFDNLEKIINNYKKMYYANTSINKFIYLLDGFDEVPNQIVTQTLLFIEGLLDKDQTKKIIISSRISSHNKFILKATFQNIEEYTIVDLSKDLINKYFQSKNDIDRSRQFEIFYENNENLYDNLPDILTLSLFWEYILQIKHTHFLSDLLNLSIHTTLNDIHYKKYLDGLNLPNPKENAILKINKELSYSLFIDNEFSFTRERLISIISKYYPKCDYQSQNNIISYLSDCFFDYNLTDNSFIFSYQHRRFLEYFAILKFETMMKEDLCFLRKKDIIVNYDMFENLLIPHLQNQSEKNNDLPLAFEISLFNVYLDNDDNWGVDKYPYYWSNYIVYAIAGLSHDLFEIVLNDTSLPIHKFFNYMGDKTISLLQTGNTNYQDLDYFYRNFISLISLMYQYGKREYLSIYLDKFLTIDNLSQGNKYYYNASVRDNFLVWRNLVYIKMIILNCDVDKILDNLIENSKDINIDNLLKNNNDISINQITAIYYNLIMYYPQKCAKTISEMNYNQLSIFIVSMATVECLERILNNNVILKTLQTVLADEITGNKLSSLACIALKGIINVQLTVNERESLTIFLEGQKFDYFSLNEDNIDFISFLFIPLNVKAKGHASIIDYIMLYRDYYRLITCDCSLQYFASQLVEYLNNAKKMKYLGQKLIGKAIAFASLDIVELKNVIDYVNYNTDNENLLKVYFTLKSYNSQQYDKLINSSMIEQLNREDIYYDIDYISTSESLFQLSFITSSKESIQGYNLLMQGIRSVVMRMDESKDSLADSVLIPGLKCIIRNNWLTSEKLKAYLDKILEITVQMKKYNIQNSTHSMLINILIQYDFDMAIYCYRQSSLIIDDNRVHYEMALGIVSRGQKIELAEEYLKNARYLINDYFQKFNLDYFYHKINVYLKIASCDFYDKNTQREYFDKAEKVIKSMVDSGWNKELNEAEYNLYIKLCNEFNKQVDVKKRVSNYPTEIHKTNKINSLEILKAINKEEALDSFIQEIRRAHKLDSIEINEVLIQKSLDITGNVNKIVNMFKDYHYPSTNRYSNNSLNFWMTVAAALKNPLSKSEMMKYLIENGGGHDGFGEMIKVFAYLGDKEMSIKLFESLLKCIEFLLC